MVALKSVNSWGKLAGDVVTKEVKVNIERVGKMEMEAELLRTHDWSSEEEREGRYFVGSLNAKGFVGDILCGCQVEGAIGLLYQGRALL